MMMVSVEQRPGWTEHVFVFQNWVGKCMLMYGCAFGVRGTSRLPKGRFFGKTFSEWIAFPTLNSVSPPVAIIQRTSWDSVRSICMFVQNLIKKGRAASTGQHLFRRHLLDWPCNRFLGPNSGCGPHNCKTAIETWAATNFSWTTFFHGSGCIQPDWLMISLGVSDTT